MKQILFFVLLLVPVCKMKCCYDEDEVDEAAERKLRTHYPQPPTPSGAAAADSSVSCPVELYQHQQPQELLSDRSLSPWRQVLVTDNNYYPSTYAKVQCLCSGCIVFQNKIAVENHDYNSVPIVQSRVFLKRELCTGKDKKYQLRPVSIDVEVGCTCARARTSSS